MPVAGKSIASLLPLQTLEALTWCSHCRFVAHDTLYCSLHLLFGSMFGPFESRMLRPTSNSEPGRTSGRYSGRSTRCSKPVWVPRAQPPAKTDKTSESPSKARLALVVSVFLNVHKRHLNSQYISVTLQDEVDETTLKWGLEAGLWKALTSKNDKGISKGDQAKELLKRYGGAYLLTSISFAIISFAACYALVNAGAAHSAAAV